jgi:hypothetical protein
MRIKTFCSLTIIPTLILVLLLLSSLDNYSIPTETYGQPLGEASLNQTNLGASSNNASLANFTTAYNSNANS